MADVEAREVRLSTIRQLLDKRSVRSQSQLVRLLRRKGYRVVQSSVSRDLRDLRVAKVGGQYQVPGASAEDAGESMENTLRTFLRKSVPAGDHLIVVHTAIGGATRVALAIDTAGWPEVLGTVAGDDTFFIAAPGRREQKRLLTRLNSMTMRG